MSDRTDDEARSLPADPFDEPEFEPVAPRRRRRRKKDPLPFWLELPLLVGAALIVAVVIKTFLFQAFWIPSSSMEDTLLVNDRVLVNKLAYRIGDLDRGHIIVFDDPNGTDNDDEGFLGAALRNVAEAVGLSTPRSEFIKRVIALPGETVEIRDDRILIDGRLLLETYLKPGSTMPDFGPVEVGTDEVFVMGDNRRQSQDSRVFGAIPQEDIVGRAFVLIWPPSRWSGL